jgi:hypothetical protein
LRRADAAPDPGLARGFLALHPAAYAARLAAIHLPNGGKSKNFICFRVAFGVQFDQNIIIPFVRFLTYGFPHGWASPKKPSLF